MGTMTISGRRIENLPTLGAINTVPLSDGAAGLAMAVTSNVRVTHSVLQAIANSTATVLAFDTERFDTDTMHDVSVNNSRITIQTAGKYIIWAGIRWQANATGDREAIILRNGTIVEASVRLPVVGVNAPTDQQPVAIVDAAVNDFFEVRVFQLSTISLNIEKAADFSPEFGAIRILG